MLNYYLRASLLTRALKQSETRPIESLLYFYSILMETALPSELLDIIAAFTAEPRLRLVSRQFMTSINKSIIDYDDSLSGL